MIESNSNRLEVISEVCHSIKQAGRSKKKSNFMGIVVMEDSILSSRYSF